MWGRKEMREREAVEGSKGEGNREGGGGVPREFQPNKW